MVNRAVDSDPTITSYGEPCTDVTVYNGYGAEYTDQWAAENVDVQYVPDDPLGFEGQYGYYGDWQIA